MNEKLAKWSLKQVRPIVGNRGKESSDELIIISEPSRRGEAKNPSLRISLHPRIVLQLGWICGDKIGMDYDNGDVVLYRDKNNGYSLSKHKKTGTRYYFRVSMPQEYADLFSGKDARSVEAENGGVAFTLVDQ